MKKIIVLSVLAMGILSFSGCSLFGNSTPALVPTVEPNTVNIEKFAFIPATMTVKKGTAVNWMNYDSTPHQIKSTIFNSSLMSKGQSVSYTFNTAGIFDYSCSLHPSMLGKIIVE